ncbi:type II toxin-antitoxin system VapC family toxin [Pelagibacterium sp.]|uniref:type II toxin-antitoxin system VapC family toxin n=1 Tax=Pelagibacterium sp. TaxID=1967288 RepID=UPI003BADBAE0
MIFVDTNVISEPLKKVPDHAVMHWLDTHDPEVVISSVAIAELAFGIERIRPDERAKRLEEGLFRIRQRYSGRIFSFTEEAAMAYGAIVGQLARRGRSLTAFDGMIAAIALVNGGRLATRNIRDFETTGLDLISPWVA